MDAKGGQEVSWWDRKLAGVTITTQSELGTCLSSECRRGFMRRFTADAQSELGVHCLTRVCTGRCCRELL